MFTFLLGVFIGAVATEIVMFSPKWPVGLIMDESITAGLIGISIFLVGFVIAVLITVNSKY